MPDETLSDDLSRRDLLRASGGVVGISGILGGSGADTDECTDATREPTTRHCDGSSMDGCRDDHPETEALRADVSDALEASFPTVGALLRDGFVPYFDLLRNGAEGSWSHWLNPTYIGDDEILNPERPAGVMVDNEWWRPLGLLFIATRDGERLEDPPSVYGDDEDEDRCSPWHTHVGLPGRYAWWKYQTVYGGGAESGLELPCSTPCMMHVWTYPNPEGVYAHAAPPRENRGGPPAEEAGFDTRATPGEDRLGVDVVAEELLENAVME